MPSSTASDPHHADAGRRLAQRASVPTAVTASKRDLICSFPVRSHGQKVEIVQGVPINEFSRAKIDASVNELKEERTLVADLLPK